MTSALKQRADSAALPMPTSQEIAEALTEIMEPVIRDLVAQQVAQLQPETGVEREAMTAEEVAIYLGLERKTVYDYANRGTIPHQRVGKRPVFGRAAISKWLPGRVHCLLDSAHGCMGRR